MTAEVVKFPSMVSDLDVPGSLRFLADWIEQNPEEASKLIVITVGNDPEYFPSVYAYGAIEGKADIVYNMEVAKHGVLTFAGDVINGGK